MAYHTAVYALLTGDASLTNLLAPVGSQTPGGQSIWYDTAPKGTVMPFLIYFSTGGPPPDFTFEAGYTEALALQFSAYAEDVSVCEQISYRVDQLLNWQTFSIDNARLMKFERTSPLDDPHMEEEVDEADVDVWRMDLLYEMTVIRSL